MFLTEVQLDWSSASICLNGSEVVYKITPYALIHIIPFVRSKYSALEGLNEKEWANLES